MDTEKSHKSRRKHSVKRRKHSENSDSDSNNYKKHKNKKKRRRSRSSSSSSSSSESESEKKLRKLMRKQRKEAKRLKKKEKRLVKDDKKSDEERCSVDVPLTLMERSKPMAPMTKEQWEKQQSVVKRVYDEQSGRHRLIKGDGEVIEEIVSRERHIAINRQATQGDGNYFQTHLSGNMSKR